MSQSEHDFLAGFAATFTEQFIARLKQEGLVHDDRPLLSTREAAARLGLGERTFVEMCERGEVASLMVAKGTRRVEPREIDRYLEQQRRAALVVSREIGEDRGSNH